MKNYVLVLVLSLLALTASAQKQENRPVEDFSYVYNGIKADVVIKQGNKSAVILKGDAKTLEEVETFVSGNKLKIKYQRNKWRNSYKKIMVYITVKDFSGAAVGGSGYIANEGTLKGDEVGLSVSGSGSLDLTLEANHIDCSISGSGDMYIKGKGKTGELSISGSGKVDAADYMLETMDITISGSGSARIYVTKAIKSEISGSGTVRFKGNPEKVYNHASGSGRLIKM